MTDTLEATARCIECDAHLHGACIGGAHVYLECVTSASGDYALFAGQLLRVVPRGEPMPSKRHVVREEYLRGAMRFAEHRKVCPKSMHVDTSKQKTRDIRPRSRPHGR